MTTTVAVLLVVGAVSGFASGMLAQRVWRLLRLRFGPCLCEDGMIRVGDAEQWEWAACPFCRRGKDILAEVEEALREVRP